MGTNNSYESLMFALRRSDSDNFIYGPGREILAHCMVDGCPHWFEIETDDTSIVFLCLQHAEVEPTITFAGGRP